MYARATPAPRLALSRKWFSTEAAFHPPAARVRDIPRAACCYRISSNTTTIKIFLHLYHQK